MPKKWIPAITYYPCRGVGETLTDRCWKDGREYGEPLIDSSQEIKFYVDTGLQSHNKQLNDISEYTFQNFHSGNGKMNGRDFSWKKDNNQLILNFLDNKMEKLKIKNAIYMIHNNKVYVIGNKSTCREIPLGERKVAGILGVIPISHATDSRKSDLCLPIGSNKICLYPDPHDSKYIAQYVGKNILLTFVIIQYYDLDNFSDPNSYQCKKKNVLKSVRLLK